MKIFILLLIFFAILMIYILYLGISVSIPIMPSQQQCFEPAGYCDYFELSSNQNNELFLSILFSNPIYDSYEIDQIVCSSSNNMSDLHFSSEPTQPTLLSRGQKAKVTVKCNVGENMTITSSSSIKIIAKIKQKINGVESDGKGDVEGSISNK